MSLTKLHILAVSKRTCVLGQRYCIWSQTRLSILSLHCLVFNVDIFVFVYICVFDFAIFVFIRAVASVGAVTVGFIRPTHVWVNFFVARCQVYSAFYDARPATLELQQQTTLKNNGDGNDNRGQWQWLWLQLSQVHNSVWSEALIAKQGVVVVAEVDIVLSGIYAIAIYWQQWRVAYLLEVSCSCPASNSLLRFIEPFYQL